MQGGAPNNSNPYGSYAAGVGGYPAQQPQQGYQQMGGRGGGYYPQQQQHAGNYAQGYPAHGGYQLQQAQQSQQQQQTMGGYAPRGGYYQGGAYGASGAPQGYGGPQQPQQQQQYNRGGYGQGYYQQQPQQQQRGYYNQGYNQQGQYGQMSRGGFQGGANRGQQPYNPQQGRGGFRGGRGGAGDFSRGGRGAGRGAGGRGGRGGNRMNDTCAVVHVETYAKLEEVGRNGATESLLPAEALSALRARSHGTPVRLLVIVQKRYAAACMSLPRHSNDALLSEKTAETFMQVSCVTANHGNRLVDIENGGHLQGAVYNIFRNLMVTLTPFDKAQVATTTAEGVESKPAVDVQERPTDELLEALTKDVATYEAVLTAMSADSDESTKLFVRLMRIDAAEEAGEENEGHDDGEADEEDGDAEHKDGEAKAATAQPSAAGTATPAHKAPRHTLMSSPQGIQLLRAALAVGSKRQVFFEKLTPPPAKPDADGLCRLEWSTSLRLLNPLFQYPLLADLVFQLFGAVPVGAQDAKAVKPKAAELKVMCEAVARYGVHLTSSVATGNTVLALLRAMDPHHAQASAAEHAAEVEASARKAGTKRGRDAEDGAEATSEDTAQKAKVEGEAAGGAKAAVPEEARAPASLAAYKAPSAPLDWHLYYALAESWCTGEQPEERRKKRNGPTPAQPEADATAEQKPATPESRLACVSRSVTGSFVVRYMMPVFADAVLSALKSPASRKKKEHDAFVQQCETILAAMAASWSTVNPTYTDGYVYRSLLTCLAARAVPGTPVEVALRTLNERIINTIFESSREKYHSHCVQEALTVARQTKEGGQFVLQVARALMEKGDDVLLSISVSPSGNYVVRHLCDQLTDYATGKVAGAEPEVVEEAKELESKYFKLMTANMAKLSGVQYGRGLVAWQNEQAARLAQSSACATAAAPAA